MTGNLTVPSIVVSSLSSVNDIVKINSQFVQSEGNFTTEGDAQRMFLVMRGLTKNGTATELFLDGSAVRASLPANTRWNAHIRIIASTDSFENRYATFDRKLLIVKGDTNATTQIVGPVQTHGMDTGSLAGSPPVGWGVTVSANTTSGCLAIFATGEVGTYVRWVAEINLVQLSYQGNLTERVESLFANGEEGVWFDPSGFDIAWRRNLLTYTEDLNNAAWSRLAVSISGSTVAAPDGTFTASSIFFSANGGATQIYQRIPSNYIGIPLIGSVWLRADTNTQMNFGFYDTPNADVSQITVTPTWQRFTKTRLTGFTATANDRRGIWLYSYSNNSRIDFWHPQVEAGLSVTDYQKIVTPDITFNSDIQTKPTLFTDDAGRTPVTGVEQTVGLILDKRGPIISYDPFTVPIDSYDANGSSTITRIGNSLLFNNASTGDGIRFNALKSIDKYSYIHFTASGSGILLVYGGGSPLTVTLTNTPTRYIASTQPNSSDFTIFRSNANGTNANIIIHKIEGDRGNHAYQATAANRPTLRARYNLLTYSEQFDNAVFTINNTTVSANSAIAPDGSFTADKILATTATAQHIIHYNFNTIKDYPYNESFYIKDGGWGERFRVSWANNTGGVFSLSSSSVTKISGDGVIESVGNGWFRISNGGLAFDTRTNQSIRILFQQNDGVESFAGGTDRGYFLWGAQITYGTSLLRYQRIAAATDYDVSGFIPYLDFDGSNDQLITNNINFSSVSATTLTVHTGVLKPTNPTSAVLVELSPNYETSSGSFAILSNYTSSTMGVASKGTSLSLIQYPIASAVSSYVFTTQSTISTDTNILRINGTQVSSSTTDQGTGFFGNHPLYIGARSGPTLPFAGRLYNLIIRTTSNTTLQTTLTERFVGNRTGITL
jgi:hypothetical protein